MALFSLLPVCMTPYNGYIRKPSQALDREENRMLDDIIEIVVELFFEILVELVPEVPRPLRIFLTCLMLVGLFGGSGLLIGLGIANETGWMIGLGGAILFATIIWFVYLIHKYRREQRLLGEC